MILFFFCFVTSCIVLSRPWNVNVWLKTTESHHELIHLLFCFLINAAGHLLNVHTWLFTRCFHSAELTSSASAGVQIRGAPCVTQSSPVVNANLPWKAQVNSGIQACGFLDVAARVCGRWCVLLASAWAQ